MTPVTGGLSHGPLNFRGGRVVLRHGTTRLRAEAIILSGPDPDFVEPGGPLPADGFSTSPVGGPFPLGSPVDYAQAKDRLFPNEGGPAILEVDVPTYILQLAIRVTGEVRFERGLGLEELLAAWRTLPRRIVP